MLSLKSILLSTLLILANGVFASDEIRLIVRADDMGAGRAANLATVDAYRDGLARTVEIMVPGPWFEEAVEMLLENPGLDVGVHLVLTSEWDGIKWRPLTYVPSITDEDGYFHPRISVYRDYVSKTYLADFDWKLEDIEKEFRAQIEMAMRKIPQVTHITGHMGSYHWNPEVRALAERLAEEYNIDIDPSDHDYAKLRGYDSTDTYEERVAKYIAALEELTPGLHMHVIHPGYDTPEMQGMGHTGYEHVAADRDAETRMVMDERVLEVIERRGIKLISYADLKE